MKRKRLYDLDDPRQSNQYHSQRNRGRGRGRGYNQSYQQRRYHNDGGGDRYHNNNNNNNMNMNRDRERGDNQMNSNNNNNNKEGATEEVVDPEEVRMSRIRQLLVRIGERSSSTLAHNLDQLSTALLVDLEHYRPFIVSTLFECVSHLAVKIPIYATLVGLINNVKADFGKDVVDKLSIELSNALQAKNDADVIDLNRIRLMSRFAVSLYNANIIALSQILCVIDLFISVLSTNSQVTDVLLKEHIAYIVMTMLVWASNGHLLQDMSAPQLQHVLDDVEHYMQNRQDTHTLRAFKPFKRIKINLLTDLWAEFNRMRSDYANNSECAAFVVKSIHAPHREFSRLKKKHEHVFTLSVTKESLSSAWSTMKKMQHVYPVWVEFGVARLLKTASTEPAAVNEKKESTTEKEEKGKENAVEEEKAAELEKVNVAMEEYVVMDYIHDIVEYFSDDSKLCAEQLINIPCAPNFECKYLVVEGVVFKMLMLPHCRRHFVFFGKIIIELFRKQTKVWPRVVGPIINVMFHSIHDMDIECRDRMVDWFSYHLANFNFQWPWENWSGVTAFPVSAPTTAFVVAVMVKCVHLSYYDRFKKTLPTEIISVVPAKPEGNYKLSADNACMNLVRMLNQRQSGDDMANHLETHAKGDETTTVLANQIEMLFSCILHVGKSSCSHVLSFLRLYGKKPLKQLMAQSEPRGDGELILLRCLFDYWTHSPVRIEMLTDKLHAMSYVTPQSIVSFVFVKDNRAHLYRQIYWIVARQAIDRIVKTTQGMQRGIDKFVLDIAELDKNLNSDFNDQEVTTLAKTNKQKQLEQLTQRLHATKHKISLVFILFFKLCMEALRDLANQENAPVEQVQTETKPDEADNGNEMDEDDEMDDDLLMSEQFIHKQEIRDKEKEKKAILKSRESNVNDYLFDIINQRMVEVARRFYLHIDESTWNELQQNVLSNVENKEIAQSVESIFDLKQLLL